jgi:hypothetical protein
MQDEEFIGPPEDVLGWLGNNDAEEIEKLSQERALDNFDKVQYALEEQTVVVERTMNSACMHILDEQRALSQRAPRWADDVR